MDDLSVRMLGEDDWQLYRDVRLTALEESPGAFVADHATEAAYADDVWQDRMRRAKRFLIDNATGPVGVASMRAGVEPLEEAAELFGLWVRPELRGTGLGVALVRAVAEAAALDGHRQLFYWVGTDNGRAVAFASSYGFRPTEYRRPVEAHDDDDSTEELAMVLALQR